MHATEIPQAIDAANAYLITAHTDLLTPELTPADIAASLDSAAGLLRSLRLSDLRHHQATAIPRLMEMATRAASIARLLDSAAMLFLGRLANTANLGYCSDGSQDQLIRSGILQVEA